MASQRRHRHQCFTLDPGVVLSGATTEQHATGTAGKHYDDLAGMTRQSRAGNDTIPAPNGTAGLLPRLLNAMRG